MSRSFIVYRHHRPAQLLRPPGGLFAFHPPESHHVVAAVAWRWRAASVPRQMLHSGRVARIFPSQPSRIAGTSSQGTVHGPLPELRAHHPTGDAELPALRLRAPVLAVEAVAGAREPGGRDLGQGVPALPRAD